jgi:hypothetical protein
MLECSPLAGSTPGTEQRAQGLTARSVTSPMRIVSI